MHTAVTIASLPQKEKWSLLFNTPSISSKIKCRKITPCSLVQLAAFLDQHHGTFLGMGAVSACIFWPMRLDAVSPLGNSTDSATTQMAHRIYLFALSQVRVLAEYMSANQLFPVARSLHNPERRILTLSTPYSGQTNAVCLIGSPPTCYDTRIIESLRRYHTHTQTHSASYLHESPTSQN